MGLAYVRTMDPVGQYQLMEIVAISPGSPPPRPTPAPPGNWSPIHPSHPIANPFPPYVDIGFPMPQPPFPGGPGGPVDPGYSPPWAQVPGGGGPGTPTPGPAGGINAVVIPMPPADPPAPPPAGMPAGSTQMLVWFGPGTKPAVAWVGPYASQQPPAAQPAPEAVKK